MVRRGTVGSASACWKAGPRDHREVCPIELTSDEEMERGLGECTVLYECDWMIVFIRNMRNKQNEWHTATKPKQKLSAQSYLDGQHL